MAAARSWEELERRLNDPCGLGGVNVGRVGTSDVSTDREDSEPEDITDEVRAEVARRSMTESQKVLMDSGNSMQKLAAMCQGLCTKIDDSGGDRPLLDLDGEDPVCMTLPNKSHYNPAVPILKLEVRRRAKMFNINLATSTMSRPALLTWLKKPRSTTWPNRPWKNRLSWRLLVCGTAIGTAPSRGSGFISLLAMTMPGEHCFKRIIAWTVLNWTLGIGQTVPNPSKRLLLVSTMTRPKF